MGFFVKQSVAMDGCQFDSMSIKKKDPKKTKRQKRGKKNVKKKAKNKTKKAEAEQ